MKEPAEYPPGYEEPPHGPYSKEDGAGARLFRELHPDLRAFLGSMDADDVAVFKKTMKRVRDAETIWGFLKFLGYLAAGSFMGMIAFLQGIAWLKNWK